MDIIIIVIKIVIIHLIIMIVMMMMMMMMMTRVQLGQVEVDRGKRGGLWPVHLIYYG